MRTIAIEGLLFWKCKYYYCKGDLNCYFFFFTGCYSEIVKLFCAKALFLKTLANFREIKKLWFGVETYDDVVLDQAHFLSRSSFVEFQNVEFDHVSSSKITNFFGFKVKFC